MRTEAKELTARAGPSKDRRYVDAGYLAASGGDNAAAEKPQGCAGSDPSRIRVNLSYRSGSLRSLAGLKPGHYSWPV